MVIGPIQQDISSTPVGQEQHGEGEREGLAVVAVHRLRCFAHPSFDNRISALKAASQELAVAAFLRDVPVVAAPLVDLLRDGPSAPVRRPVRNPARRVGWMHSRTS
ncbi:hypothetical protein [Streptomyces sp. NPDC059378]|uniref:hypothetical protein n=1 Tax=Streptomyces sp. NPDC059378 TaxID=3346815 RepID=UPI0036A239CC